MRIRTGARLHFGLLDMNGELGRVDGGVGLALSEPAVEITAEPATEVSVVGDHSDRVEAAAHAVLEYLDGKREDGGEGGCGPSDAEASGSGATAGVSIEIVESFPEHVGLGSGTQLALAGGLAALRANGETLPVPELASVTGRGGTSGIGTAAFEAGGFVLDGGHDAAAKDGFLPSSAASVEPPPVLSRLDFPDWEIGVVLPAGSGAHGKAETAIFETECPIPGEEVETLSRNVLTLLLPAVASGDFEGFRRAVSRMQEVGFKRREIARQSASEAVIDRLHDRGYAAGMSSFGPAVFAVHPDRLELGDLAARVYRTSANNHGAEIE